MGNVIAKLSTRHEAIMLWLLENPDQPMRACAQQFNVTPSWLSQLIHSDLFRERLAAKFHALYEAGPLTTHQRLSALADQAIERVSEHMDTSPDPFYATIVADMALRRLGYGARPIGTQINIQQNNALASPEAIERANLVMVQVRQAVPGIAPTDDTQADSPPTKK